MASLITAQLLFLEFENPKKDIFMYINSPGGVVTAGLAIHDTMQYIRPKVSTVCIGQAASMGSFLLCAGEPGMRIALTNSRIMIHQPSGGAQGMASDIEIQAREILRMRTRLNTLYAKYTGQPIEEIEMAMDRDKFLEADEAKELRPDRRSVRPPSRPGRGRHHRRGRHHAGVGEAIRQVGALAYRRVGKKAGAPIEIMLVTSRQTRRWIIPKGNIDHGMSPHAAAAQEAEEEAGVRGDIGHDPLGSFTYEKQVVSGLCITAKVVVFPLAVHEVMDEWKESKWRRRKWFPVDEVADAIQEPGLRKIIDAFAAAMRGKAG